jgi:hypothetical protein
MQDAKFMRPFYKECSLHWENQHWGLNDTQDLVVVVGTLDPAMGFKFSIPKYPARLHLVNFIPSSFVQLSSKFGLNIHWTTGYCWPKAFRFLIPKLIRIIPQDRRTLPWLEAPPPSNIQFTLILLKALAYKHAQDLHAFHLGWWLGLTLE